MGNKSNVSLKADHPPSGFYGLILGLWRRVSALKLRRSPLTFKDVTMVKHIVFWTLKDSAEGRSAHQNAKEMKKRLEALNGRIPGLIKLEVGIDFGRTEASADVALYSELSDRNALNHYINHPEHVAVSDFVGKIRHDRTVVDYEI